jgi:hypothetical protein
VVLPLGGPFQSVSQHPQSSEQEIGMFTSLSSPPSRLRLEGRRIRGQIEPALGEGLARSLGLSDSANYCDIADELLNRADRFLAEVKAQPHLSRLRPGVVSSSDFLH